MYKFIAVIFSVVLILSLSACGGTEAKQTSGVEASQTDSANEPLSENNDEAAAEAKLSFTGEIGGEITISSYDAMTYKAFLEIAARLFEEKYPGTTVNVETFSAMPEIKTSDDMVMVAFQDDPQGRQDYINRINTALMSGEGADILTMDVLPFYKYADAGQLENLASYMQSDASFNKADYRTNILDAVEYKNGTWFLPMDYTFHYYAYDSSLLTDGTASGFGINGNFTTQELIALAEPYFDENSKIFNRLDYARGPGGCIWDSLLEENYTSFVNIENKIANFSDGSFESLLESVKQYSEQGYISKGTTGQSNEGRMMQRSGENATDRIFFKPKNVFNLIALFSRDLDVQMNIMAEGDTMAIGDDDEIAGVVAYSDGSVPFTYNQAYGINANSANKETSWAFLKFLLSEEMQLNTGLSPTSLPVSNAAREKKLPGMMGQQGQPINEAQLEVIAKYNETVNLLSDRIDAYVIRDTSIDDMIAAEVQHFFEGTKTAAEVADVLQNKVDLYLNE